MDALIIQLSSLDLCQYNELLFYFYFFTRLTIYLIQYEQHTYNYL